MVERGTIALADPVTHYLPAFTPALANGETPTITLRHLLTHTAGLSYGFMQPPDGSYHRAGVSDGMDAPGLAMADELQRIVRAGLACPPGERWAYSVAMDVLRRGAGNGRRPRSRCRGGRTCHRAAAARFHPVRSRAAAGRTVGDALCGPAPPLRMPEGGHRVHFPDGIPLYAGLAGINLVPARVFDHASFRSSGAGMVGTAGDMLAFNEAVRAGGGPILTQRVRPP